MMMRKRTRSIQKDQEMSHLMRDAISRSCLESDVLGQKQKTGSFINAPGLFVGFTPKALEPDSVRSPTSPLDFKLFPNITNPFRSPRSPKEGHQMKWDNSKVGLSIVDSLVDDEDDDDADNAGKPGRVIGSSASKSILFGPKMRIDSLKLQSRSDSFDQAPKSLPKNYGYFPRAQVKPSNLQKGCSNDVFGIRKTTFEQEALGSSSLSCSLDSGSHLTCLTNRTSYPASGNFGSAKRTNPANSPSRLSDESYNFFGALTASEIELSEDYTCVKTYGPNPKTTHIFGDCILECHQNNLTDLSNNGRQKIQLPQAKPVQCLETSALYPSSDFLSFCYSCNKKLEGEDIYMYRGEAFCSSGCRLEEILIKEAMEEEESPNNAPPAVAAESSDQPTLFIAV